MPLVGRFLATENASAAGQRDCLVTIQSKTPATSGYPVETWATLGTEWMSKIDQTGVEQFSAGQLSAATTTIFDMPYRADMDPDLVDVPGERRLVYRGRAYDVTAATTLRRGLLIRLITLAASKVEAP